MPDIIKAAILNVFHEALKSAGVAVLQDIVAVVQHYEAQGSSLFTTGEVAPVAPAIASPAVTQ